MQKKVFLPPITTAKRPMTIAEKIFARHMLNAENEQGVAYVKPSDSGFARTDLRFSHEYVTPMSAIFFEHFVGKDAKVNDPATPPVGRPARYPDGVDVDRGPAGLPAAASAPASRWPSSRWPG